MPAVEVWPRAVVPPAFVAARIMDILRSGVEVGEDGEHAAVVVIGGGQAELAEDAVDVLADGLVGDEQPSTDAALERPSAMSPSTSRSRGVSSARGSSRWRRLRSWATTSGSMTVPPPATRRTASMNWSTSRPGP